MRRAVSRSIVVVLGCALATFSCAKEKAAHTPAATIANPVSEGSLTTVTLTEQAVARLGIATETVRSSNEAPRRTVGGEVVVPPGQALLVSAPIAGTILAPPSGAIPSAGSPVSQRQTLLRLVALPSDRDFLRTEQALAATAARLRQAAAEAQRTAKLFQQNLVSPQQNERVAADLAAAQADYDAAAAQQALIRRGTPRDAAGLAPFAITAPEAGVVRAVAVAPGQAVAAGAPLAEIVRLDRLWVRVPVYAGAAATVSRRDPVTIRALGGAPGGEELRGLPVAAPPAADPASSSVYLFYEVRGAGHLLRPGERVSVSLPLAASPRASLSVSLSAIVRDLHGGAWVYERTDARTFVRRRVEVARVEGDRAILAAGSREGSEVVVGGAAELFGTEFGAGK